MKKQDYLNDELVKKDNDVWPINKKRYINSISRFILESKAKFHDYFNYSKTVYCSIDSEVIITCPKHGDFNIKPEVHLRSRYGCQKCNYCIPAAVREKDFIKISNIRHNNKYDYSKVKYINALTNVEIICPIHGSFHQLPYTHQIAEVGCKLCSKDNEKVSIDEFIERSRLLYGDRYNYDKVVLENINSKVIITCPKHGDWVQRAGSHIYGNKCRGCYLDDDYERYNVEFIKNAIAVHGNKYDYSKVVYIGSKKKVEIICPVHGSFWIKPNTHISSKAGCKSCIESKGETALRNILNKYNFNFIQEYKVLPYMYRYDFFLPSFNIYIEYNGIQHYKPVKRFGGNEAYLKTIKNDKLKKSIVRQNNGCLITISYHHSDEKTIELELIKYLKLTFKYWFLIDGKISVFKKSIEVYKFFNVPKNILIEKLSDYVIQNNKNVEKLFK